MKNGQPPRPGPTEPKTTARPRARAVTLRMERHRDLGRLHRDQQKKLLKVTRAMEADAEKFGSLGLAIRFSSQLSNLTRIIQGDDDLFWVVDRPDGDWLIAHGYEAVK